MENRSKAILGMEDSAFARSLFKSMGYTDSELKEGKPLIGIANTWNTLVPGHYNLDKVAEYVKNGIYAAGGTAVEFGTIAACDGVAQGHEGMSTFCPPVRSSATPWRSWRRPTGWTVWYCWPPAIRSCLPC